MQTFKKLLFLLSNHERKSASLLLVMILIMALLDMVGVVSILPFVAVLTNPSLIETNLMLSTLFQFSKMFGVENNNQFLFVLGVLVFIILILSLTFKGFTVYMQVRFVQMRQFSISKRLVEEYLHQPYSWFLNHNSAELGKTILSEVGQVAGNGLAPLVDLIGKSMITLMLIALLILVDPKLSLIIGLSLSLSYVIIFYVLRKYLNLLGKKNLESNEQRFRAVSEAFGAAKEIKVGGLEQTYIKHFSNAAKIFSETHVTSQTMSQSPRYLLEAITFGGILLIILYLIDQTNSINNSLPVLSLYIFAGYRLMPALQSIYGSFSRLTFVGPSLDKLYNDFKNLKPSNLSQDKGTLPLNDKIMLKNIHYNYPNTSRTALKDISLTIPSKSIVGLVGATGSGKTTTVDIILGLLEAQKGTLEVDGKIITKQNSRSWQRSIGYVPQHIYLSDDSVKANIAYGVEVKDINQEAVETASKIANLHKFVNKELSEQYDTIIGERGVRLSGGQRQRIGIARALYHSPQVLILDEATSSLDSETEQAVMDAINNLSKDITIILIAHRLNTVKNCDIVFKLDMGQLTNHGTFDEVINDNKNLGATS